MYIPKKSHAGLSPIHRVEAYDASGNVQQIDIAGELPLTICVNHQEIVTLMTLGTHPEDLVLGYLKNQRLITRLEEVESVTVDWDRETAQVQTRGPGQKDFNDRLAHRIITTGCGQGTLFSCTLDELYEVKPEPITLCQSTLNRLLKNLARCNAVYKAAGAVHGCALCQEETVEIFIEDVGRHNALDTIAGQMWLNRIPGRGKLLYTTGRLTSEIVIKAALMEIPVIISRSGITQMGLELARDLGITMIARAKGNRFLVFTGHDRFVHDSDKKA